MQEETFYCISIFSSTDFSSKNECKPIPNLIKRELQYFNSKSESKCSIKNEIAKTGENSGYRNRNEIAQQTNSSDNKSKYE